MERTFFPGRGYWFTYALIVGCWLLLIGCYLFLTQLEGGPADFRAIRWHTSVAFWCILVIGAVYVPSAAGHALLAYRRKRLVIGKEEVRCHGPLLVCTIRFTDIIEAHWLWRRESARPYGLRLSTARKQLAILFGHFVPGEAQGALIDLFRQQLGPVARHDWDAVEAVHEGRASAWSPPIFTLKTVSRMLAISTGLAVAIGAGLGALLQRRAGVVELWTSAVRHNEIRTLIPLPGAAKWPWSGRVILDWGLGIGLMGLVVGILFLGLFWLLEWSSRKWSLIQARRLDRAMSPSPESHGG